MSTELPGPGWYPDPNDPQTNRYWDGESWTQSRAPRASVAATPEKRQKAEGADVVGYVLAVLMPFVGFIMGLVLLNKSRHGVWIVLTSVVAFIIWIAIVSADSGGGYYAEI